MSDDQARPSGSASPSSQPSRYGSGATPRHDRISDAALSDYADLFRDPPAPPGGRPAPGTQVLGQSDFAAPPHYVGRPAGPASPAGPAGPGGPGAPLDPQGPAARPAPSSPRRPRKGRFKRIALFALIAVIAYVVALGAYFATSVRTINAMPSQQIADTAGSNYLLVGSDGREGLTSKQRRVLHTGGDAGQRTDTIMLLHVPLIGTPTLISIPRDSWVSIPGHDGAKINAAYSLGGAPLLVSTVEQATGVHIDHYVEIGMLGVADVADALGGVTLCPKADYNDKNSGLKVKQGCQEMAGPKALAYVRMRYADPKGDLGRMERQQEFVKAVAAKTANPLTWLNPFKMLSVDRAAGQSLTVDEGTGVFADARMGVALGMLAAGLGDMTSVPVQADTYWVDGQAAIKWKPAQASQLFQSIGA